MLRARWSVGALAFFGAALLPGAARAQCLDYVIQMPSGPGDTEISWSLVDQNGVTWLSGGAPFGPATICLPDGCYTLLMFDSGGDGWDGLDWDIELDAGGWDDHTTLNNGSQDFEQFEIGPTADCNQGGGNNCSGGQNPYYINSDPGLNPLQMTWTLALNSVVISSGGSNTNDTLCLDPTCLVLVMNDSGGNGWQGGSITITDENGATVYNGTLAGGSTQTVNIPIDGGSCSNPGGGGPGGGGGGPVPGTGPGGGCSNLPPGSDCATAGCACDPFTFDITPSGFGNVNEVPPPGSVSNPSFFSGGPWGGTSPFGCLLAGELNSTWILFTVGSSGSLSFSFGAGGGQAGFYDWAMWPFTGAASCSAIATNTLPPVRCVWNATSAGGTGLASPPPPGGSPGNFAPPLAVTAGQQFIICFSNWSFVNTSVSLDFFGTAGIQCGPTVLPVELLTFDAVNDGPTVLTSWTTATETGSDHFDVERSATGEQWTRVGRVAAVGNSQVLSNYAWVDHAPLEGWSYYRLKEFNADGHALITSTAVVQRGSGGELHAWPMPCIGTFQVEGLAGDPLLVDATGRQVPVQWERSSPHGPVSVSMLRPATGLYTLVDAGAAARTLRIVVSDVQ